ncbi:MarR family transcriptional regulator [Arthrobacter sp. MN05-02]|nr:MarR family transcriptional regulator [Arthrobacter sp. MN05-02]
MDSSTGRFLGPADNLPTIDLVRRMSIFVAGLEKEHAEQAGLNVTATRALALIVEADAGVEAFNPRALADVLDMSTASMTAITDRLEGAGLVERRPNVADRRRICLHPTQQGSSLHHRLRHELKTAVDTGLAALTSPEHRAFRKGLTALARL